MTDGKKKRIREILEDLQNDSVQNSMQDLPAKADEYLVNQSLVEIEKEWPKERTINVRILHAE